MFLLSLQLTAKLGNDSEWKVMETFHSFYLNLSSHSQSAIYRGGQQGQ